MPWRLTHDVEEYAGHTADLLASDPAAQTVALTVLDTVRSGRRWSDEPMLFGWLEQGGEVRGALFRTPPFELLLAVVPEDATAELIATLRAAGEAVPGVNGDEATVARFAAAWTATTGDRGTTTVAMDLYELGTLQPPEPAPAGRARGRRREPRARGALVHGLPGRDAVALTPRTPTSLPSAVVVLRVGGRPATPAGAGSRRRPRPRPRAR